ncbi:helix-turn-helix domain-containing protein [Amycolatopsis anabasis]|uniref:helix-turn-helix domain-containing protein n=1 Tax=Amycolatopsis anabasis TaxID=1840409 RepID=UPI00131C5CE5|nr:helix-turn-helix transcriptional regulator [Amycolatopsis anabasis]
MAGGDALGENLARLRKAHDISQAELATAAGLSLSTVAKIEQGHRVHCRPDTLQKLADTLGTTADRLLGNVLVPTARDLDVAALRRAITASEHVPGLVDDFADDREVLTLGELTRTTHRAWRAYVDGRHHDTMLALPVLLVDARRLVRNSSGRENASAHRILSTAYRLGAGMAGRIGYEDLAWSSAERALDAARQCDAPEVERAISLRYLAWALVRQGRTAEAERVAVQAAEQIQPAMLDRDSDRAGVFGNLLFNAASAALFARPQRVDRAEDLLSEARAAAVRARADSATEAGIFGPRVAALQLVDCAARAGDPERALRLAAAVPRARGKVPAFWEAGHQLRLASAATALRQYRSALRHLATARELAPDWVKYQPLGKATMHRLVDRAPRRQGETFARLATHYGVIDMAS